MIPYYYLHPCETATLMRSIIVFEEAEAKESHEERRGEEDDYSNQEKGKGKKIMMTPDLEGYIRSWLSFVGPVIGIKVGMESFLPEEDTISE